MFSRFLILTIVTIAAVAPAANAGTLEAGDFDPDFGKQQWRIGIAPLESRDEAWFRFHQIAFDSSDRVLLVGSDCRGGPAAYDDCSASLYTLSPDGRDYQLLADIESGYLSPPDFALDSEDRIWVSYSRASKNAGSILQVDHVVRRFEANGNPDNTFGTAGELTFAPSGDDIGLVATHITIDANDHVYLLRGIVTDEPWYSTEAFEIMRLNDNGIGFDTFRMVGGFELMNLEVDRVGRPMVMALDADTWVASIYRVLADGSALDAAFGDNGSVDLDESLTSDDIWVLPLRFALDPFDRSVVVGGIATFDADSGDYAEFHGVWRFDDEGLLDETFGLGEIRGWAVYPALYWGDYAIAINGNAEIVIEAYSEFAATGIERYYLTANGFPDTSRADAGRSRTGPFKTLSGSMAYRDDGSLFSTGRYSLPGIEDSTREGGPAASVVRYLGEGETRAVDQEPLAFAFPTEYMADPLRFVASPAITLSGMDTGALLVVSNEAGSSVKLGDGAWANDGGYLVPPNPALQVKHYTGSAGGVSRRTEISVGGVTGDFTTVTIDDIPDPVWIPSQVDVEPDTDVVIGPIAVTGFEAPATIGFPGIYTGGPDTPVKFSIDGENWLNAIEVRPGDRIYARIRSSDRLSHVVTGGVYWEYPSNSSTFTVKTRNAILDILPFTFDPIEGAEPRETYESNTVVPLAGESMVNMMVEGCEYRIGEEGEWVSGVNYAIAPEQSLTLRNTSGNWDETVSCTVTVGNRTQAFSITTRPEPLPVDIVPEPLPLPAVIEELPGTSVVLGPYLVTGINTSIEIGNAGSGDTNAEFQLEGDTFKSVITASNGDSIWIRFETPAAGVSRKVAIYLANLDNVQTITVAGVENEPGSTSGGGPLSIWLLSLLLGIRFCFRR